MLNWLWGSRMCILTKIWFKFYKYFQKEMQEFIQDVGKSARKCYSYSFTGMFKQFYLESKTHFSDSRDYIDRIINSQKTKLILTVFLSLLETMSQNKHIETYPMWVLSFASEAQLWRYRMMRFLFENKICSHNLGDLTIICGWKKRQLRQI